MRGGQRTLPEKCRGDALPAAIWKSPSDERSLNR